MNTRFTTGIIVLFASITVPALADLEKPVSVPEKVSANILKRHPHAQDLQASYESHFGVKLLEVSFKTEADESVQELFTLNGHLFTNELSMNGLSELSAAASATLQQEFPHYLLKKAERVTNPNGVGEEYEIYLHADGRDWKVCINEKGNLVQKDPLP